MSRNGGGALLKVGGQSGLAGYFGKYKVHSEWLAMEFDPTWSLLIKMLHRFPGRHPVDTRHSVLPRAQAQTFRLAQHRPEMFTVGKLTTECVNLVHFILMRK